MRRTETTEKRWRKMEKRRAAHGPRFTGTDRRPFSADHRESPRWKGRPMRFKPHTRPSPGSEAAARDAVTTPSRAPLYRAAVRTPPL